MITFKLYFIFILNLKKILSDYITFPLIKLKNESQNDDIQSCILSELFDTYYLIRINLSNNNQTDCTISSKGINLSINETVNNYPIKSSSTFEIKSEICSDIFPLNTKNIKDAPSIIETRLNFSLITSNNQTCEIGLGIPVYKDDKSKNLIIQLKKLNLTNLYIFTFNFNENYFRFGDLPEFTHPEKYKKEDFYFTSSTTSQKYYFGLEFDKLIFISKINDDVKEITNYLSGTIEFEINYIVGTDNFMKIIQEQFFNNYTDLCKEEIITYQKNQYSTFYCENKDDIIKNFPLVVLYHIDFSIKFSFNSDDLFTEIKSGKYLFNIIFPIKKLYSWKFGVPFIRKYQFFLNIDNAVINYYNGNNINKTDIIIDDEPRNFSLLKIIVIIVLVFAVFVLGYFLGKLIYQKQMKKAKELNEDNYDYSDNLKIND